MKPLLKVLFVVAAFFASTFIIIKSTGVLTIEQIEGWLVQAKELSPFYVGLIVSCLLFADLFIAVPTLTITILSGFFLGHHYGAVAALAGTMLAGICGYTISLYYGERFLTFLVKDEDKRIEAINAFHQNGFAMILLSRAVPILPEATACLAGITKMTFNKFLLAWSISTVPYVLLASYAGSISSLENPKPAILTAISISILLWLSWFFFHRSQRNKVA